MATKKNNEMLPNPTRKQLIEALRHVVADVRPSMSDFESDDAIKILKDAGIFPIVEQLKQALDRGERFYREIVGEAGDETEIHRKYDAICRENRGKYESAIKERNEDLGSIERKLEYESLSVAEAQKMISDFKTKYSK